MMKNSLHLWILVVYAACAATGDVSIQILVSLYLTFHAQFPAIEQSRETLGDVGGHTRRYDGHKPLTRIQPSESSDADVAILRNVVSSLPSSHPLYVSLLSPSVSTSGLRQMAGWLGGHNPNWQHYPRNLLVALLSGYRHHFSSQVRPQGQLFQVKPSAQIHHQMQPGKIHEINPTVEVNPPSQTYQGKQPVNVDVAPLDFSSWYRLWAEEDIGQCGIPDVESAVKASRIVGGSVAKRGSWPWMVSMSIIQMNQHWCGGVLMSRQWVLTAPHCIYMFPWTRNPSAWLATLGTFNASSGVAEPTTEQVLKIDRILIHPDYKSHEVYRPSLNRTLHVPDNDIALVKLERPVNITKWVKPLCLPYNDEVPEPGQRCVASGFGQTLERQGPGALNEAVIPVYSYRQCLRFPGYWQLITRNNVCAGYKDGKIDTCNFDSGGPLQCMFRNRWVIAGITSYGDRAEHGCGKPLRPGVYTKTVNFVEWIHQQIYLDYKQTFSQLK